MQVTSDRDEVRARAERAAEGGAVRDPSWDPEEAATLLWELTSFRVWDDLVNESGLKPDRYVQIITTAALAALASPVPAPPSSAPVPGRAASRHGGLR